MANVTVSGLGGALQGWLEVHVHRAFDKLAGEAQVVMSELPGRPLPLKLGDPVVVLIDGRPVVTGFVNEVHGSLDEHSHKITITVRDKTQDFIDSTVGPNLKIKPPITPAQLVQQTLGVMGLPIGVMDQVGAPPYDKGEVPSASIDERGFAFADKWLQKRQCLMTGDGKGNIIIARNQGLPGGGMLFSGFEDSPRNNIKRSNYRITDLNRHNKVNVNAQKSTNNQQYFEGQPKGFAPAQANPLQNQIGIGEDPGVRPARKLHTRGAQGLDAQSPTAAAQWLANVNKGRSLHYSATVAGFYGGPPGAQGGWLWWPGFLVPVVDPHWELETVLLIKEVRFSKTWQAGETTDVTCTFPDAFSLGGGGSGASSAYGRTSSLGTGQ